jgi:hypothetical protein
MANRILALVEHPASNPNIAEEVIPPQDDRDHGDPGAPHRRPA